MDKASNQEWFENSFKLQICNLHIYVLLLQMYLLSAFLYLSIIAAQQKRRPGYYVPYLVFEVGKIHKN
jgi:hypothetical protein